MGINIKSDKEIESMRKGGKILAKVLELVMENAVAGISTKELDAMAEDFIIKNGGKPGFKGYGGFPATLCTARNEVIVHGIPHKDDILQEGDIFTADCGVIYEGFNTDAARSKGIGKVSPLKQKLLDTSKRALSETIDLIKPGLPLNEIGKNIEKIVNAAGFKIIHDLTGHGIGRKLHESPHILNYYDGKPGPLLKAGMTLAIEPIFSASTHNMVTLKDGWTLATEDKSPSVQEENTILVTQNGCEILTQV